MSFRWFFGPNDDIKKSFEINCPLGKVFSESKSVTFSRLHCTYIVWVALLSNQQLPCGAGVSHNFVNLFPLCSLYHCAIESEMKHERRISLSR